MDLQPLTFGAAHTAFEEWMNNFSDSVEKEALPRSGTNGFLQGSATAFASHSEKLAAASRRMNKGVVVLLLRGRISHHGVKTRALSAIFLLFNKKNIIIIVLFSISF